MAEAVVGDGDGGLGEVVDGRPPTLSVHSNNTVNHCQPFGSDAAVLSRCYFISVVRLTSTHRASSPACARGSVCSAVTLSWAAVGSAVESDTQLHLADLVFNLLR